MDSNFHSLPPLKRFRLLQQQLQSEPKTLPPNPLQLSPSNLPTKKRKQSRHSFSDSNESQEKENIPPNPITCLPAKKRIWALQPQLSPIKSPPRFDLNLEYNPNEEEINTTHIEIEPKKDEENNDEIDDGILCSVCLSTDADPLDPIVFCDGCDLMVHSSCYGNPLIKSIPEGEWFCNLCSKSKQPSNNNKSCCCCLCPENGGAMKETNDGKWAHIVCALLIPEVFFEDSEGRDGIEILRIPKRRWEGRCYLCKGKEGCVVECSEMKCGLMFHVSCGLKEDLCIELKQGKGKGSNNGGVVAAFCKDHTQLWEKQKQTGKFKIVARDEEVKA